MIVNRIPTNPTIPKVAMELNKNGRLEYLSLVDGTNIRDGWIKLLAFVIIALAAIGAGAMGWIFATFAEAALDLVTAVTLFCGGCVGALVGLFVLDLLLNAGSASYEAEFSDHQKPTGRSFPQAAGTPGKRISLSEDDKRLLQIFARHYPARQTLAINRWEGRGNPLTREEIKRVRSVLYGLGLAERDASNKVELNEAGKGRLAFWSIGEFEEPPPLPHERGQAHV